ncbi:hypothetical protein [uncultured Sphaerochaeta sp.]|uniref:hypothetical protein n=1 Tax=uncultured Sphaerochaeta sp. TaxID=886478 RepID=UPI002A0A53F1|nr:hypothetical protein [uncultured Sphaerochaeta sp.]
MKKSVRINLLVITSVLAIFVFAGVWYFRPGVSNDILERARQRQLKPLLEIQEPLKPSIEAVPATVATSEVDQKALAEQLLPALREQLTSSLEDDLYEKLKVRFTDDEQVINLFADKLEPKLEEKLTPVMQKAFDQYSAANMGNASSSSLVDLKVSLQKEFDDKLAAMESEILKTSVQANDQQLEKRIATLKGELSDELTAYIPQLVDLMLPQVVEGVYQDLTKNKDTYLPYIAEELKAYLPQTPSEDQMLALYAKYRDRIIADLVPAILDSMQKPATESVNSMVESLAPTPAVTEPAVAKVSTVVASTEKTPVVPAPPATVTVTSKAKEILPVITQPVFTEDQPVVLMEPAVYEQQRDSIRKQAIDAILERLNSQE